MRIEISSGKVLGAMESPGHWIDVAQWYMGEDYPIRATATGTRAILKQRQTPDTMSAALMYFSTELRDTPIASPSCCWESSWPARRTRTSFLMG